MACVGSPRGARILLKRASVATRDGVLLDQKLVQHRPLGRLLQASKSSELTLKPVGKQTGIEAFEVPPGQSVQSWLTALNQHPGAVLKGCSS